MCERLCCRVAQGWEDALVLSNVERLLSEKWTRVGPGRAEVGESCLIVLERKVGLRTWGGHEVCLFLSERKIDLGARGGEESCLVLAERKIGLGAGCW